ncbi:MAG TPA: CHAP domain-containing protein [Ktedonobacterales bacterium]
MDGRSTLVTGVRRIVREVRLLDRRRALALVLGVMLCVPLLGVLVLDTPDFVHAQPNIGLNSAAACSQLAHQDPTATNGSEWGRTILAGHNAPRGWFGVDVCSNGLNVAAPNPANVSCDALPSNWPARGCAPGGATRDGFGLTFQCVELITRFAAWAFGDQPSAWLGDAPDLWLPGNHPSDWVMYANGSKTAPVPGDVLVFGSVTANGAPWPAGADGEHGGHVAVVAAVRGGEIVTAEQNVKWGSEDHPSDQLGLTHAGGRWIVSGSTSHSTALPAFRWQSTMGSTRAVYGWLHSTKNTGTFPAHSGSSQATSSAPAVTPKQAPGVLPSLSGATVVTSAGTLADLTWTAGGVLPGDDVNAPTHVAVRSLGAPDTSPIALEQTPATVVLPDGRRYTYAVGTDGHLYVARTAPQVFGTYWFDHGAPDGVRLQPGVSATTYAGGMGVAALGSDGNLWWRAGPVGNLGNWLPLGHPAGTTLAGGFELRGAPGSGSPLLLALGSDGTLYERVWQQPVSGADGAMQVPAGWSDWLALHLAPANVQLSGALLAVPESANPQFWIGGWPDTPLDVFALDTRGGLWLFRSSGLAHGWSASRITLSHTPTALIAGTAVSAAPAQSSAATSGATGSAAAATATATPKATASATATSAPNAQGALLHVYLSASNGVVLAAVSLTTAKPPSNVQPVETLLPPVAIASRLPAVALPVGPGASVLIAPEVEDILIGGSSDGVAALLPSSIPAPTPASSSSGSSPAQPAPLWVSAGRVAQGTSFDDAFTRRSLDARWTLVGPQARPLASDHGLTLTAPGGEAALLQSVPTGDHLTLAVTVTLPAHPSSDFRAGLLLYLDDGDWLTLAVQRGQVALCGSAWGQAAPCVTQKLSVPSGSGTGVTLRLTRDANGYSGQVSLDGTSWSTVGSWAPALPTKPTNATPGATPKATGTATATATTTPSATASPGSGTPTLAPVAFTECGVLVAGSTSADSAPLFTNYTQSAQPASGA